MLRVNRSWLKSLIVCAAVLACGTAFAQSETEARFVLKSVQDWLPGTYDNEAQVFVEGAFGAGDEGKHPWLHLEIEAVEDSGLGDAVFLLSRSNRSVPDEPPALQLLAFSIDKPMRAVRMQVYDLPAGTTAGDGGVAAIAANATITDPLCPVYWRQGPGHVYGAMQGGWCSAKNGDSEVQQRADMTLTADEFWMYRATKVSGGERLVGGREDEVPLRFKRAMTYECFVTIRHPDGTKSTTINPFFITDGGGQFFFETKEKTPRKMEVFLRRSMWTSNSGKNFIPMLLLMLHEEGGNRQLPLMTSWAHEDSGLVGWFAPELGSGSCKLKSPADKK